MSLYVVVVRTNKTKKLPLFIRGQASFPLDLHRNTLSPYSADLVLQSRQTKMAAVVHYRFPNSKQYVSVGFEGTHISLAELKEAIKRKSIGNCSDLLQIKNAHTNDGLYLTDSLLRNFLYIGTYTLFILSTSIVRWHGILRLKVHPTCCHVAVHHFQK